MMPKGGRLAYLDSKEVYKGLLELIPHDRIPYEKVL